MGCHQSLKRRSRGDSSATMTRLVKLCYVKNVVCLQKWSVRVPHLFHKDTETLSHSHINDVL